MSGMSDETKRMLRRRKRRRRRRQWAERRERDACSVDRAHQRKAARCRAMAVAYFQRKRDGEPFPAASVLADVREGGTGL